MEKKQYIAGTSDNRCSECGCDLAHEPIHGLPKKCCSCWAKEQSYTIISKGERAIVVKIRS
jgi:hypothetical protein